MRTPAGLIILWVTSAGTTLPRSMLEVSQSFWVSVFLREFDVIGARSNSFDITQTKTGYLRRQVC